MYNSHRPSRLLSNNPCLFPLDPMKMSCFDLRASGPSAPKRPMAAPRISLATGKPSSIQARRTIHNAQNQPAQLDLHQSTCLNLNTTTDSTTESNLWILPEIDEWETDPEPPCPQPICHNSAQKTGSWTLLVKRAVSSNRERLRRRLEGDGWDFVGGKYGEDGSVLKEEGDVRHQAIDQESLDEEFDVVVLPMFSVSC